MPESHITDQINKVGEINTINKNSNNQNKKLVSKAEEGISNKKHILSDSDSLSSSEDSGKFRWILTNKLNHNFSYQNNFFSINTNK